jgi:hypothetical protein
LSIFWRASLFLCPSPSHIPQSSSFHTPQLTP